MIELMVFDMAGTTVDEDNVVYKTLQKCISEAGCEVSLNQVLALGAGKEKLQAIKDIVSNHDDNPSLSPGEIHAKFLSELQEAYRNLEVHAFAGCDTLFQVLRENKIKVALNTGYDRPTAESLVQKIGWEVGRDIDALVTASDVQNNRPAPDMIHVAMELTGVVEADHVGKVGDSQIDVEEGKNAGCGLTIGVTTGAHTRDQLAASHPDHIVTEIGQISDLLDL